MGQPQPAELLRIHISEADRFEGRPLYEAIVARCRELKIAGATVFLGLEGYGETAALHRAHLLHSDRPVVIAIVDTAENIRRLIPAIEPMIGTGLLATSEVRMVRVERPPAAPG
jgi:PII-like signaling protein